MTLLAIISVFRILVCLYLVGLSIALGVSARIWIHAYDPEPPEWYMALSIAWPLTAPVLLGTWIEKEIL